MLEGDTSKDFLEATKKDLVSMIDVDTDGRKGITKGYIQFSLSTKLRKVFKTGKTRLIKHYIMTSVELVILFVKT